MIAHENSILVACNITGARSGSRTRRNQTLDLARLPISPSGHIRFLQHVRIRCISEEWNAVLYGAQSGTRTHNHRLLRPARLPIAPPGRRQRKTPCGRAEGVSRNRANTRSNFYAQPSRPARSRPSRLHRLLRRMFIGGGFCASFYSMSSGFYKVF